MTDFDRKFIDMCKKILDEGEVVPCRAKWDDGTQANTIHITNVVNEYDVGKEFPIMTIRKQGIKGPIRELLWIFQQKSNNVGDLGLNIWDSWADETGSIGKAYGYQIGKKYVHHWINKHNEPDIQTLLKKDYPSYEEIDSNQSDKVYVLLDQIDAVIWDLRHEPTSRRIMTNTYNLEELHEMGLYPCAYSTTWNVFNGKLNLILNQRSQDVLAANYWNVCQYAALLVMVAKATGLEIGKLTHVISDCHIYDRHVDIIKDLITREGHAYPSAVLFTNESVNFYDYDPSDFVVEGYEADPSERFPVAV